MSESEGMDEMNGMKQTSERNSIQAAGVSGAGSGAAAKIERIVQAYDKKESVPFSGVIRMSRGASHVVANLDGPIWRLAAEAAEALGSEE